MLAGRRVKRTVLLVHLLLCHSLGSRIDQKFITTILFQKSIMKASASSWLAPGGSAPTGLVWLYLCS